MTEAARILSQLATHRPSSARAEQSPEGPNASENHDLVWLTDREGDPTFDSHVSQALMDRLGLSYLVQDGEFHALTDDEYSVVRNRETVSSKYKNGWSISVGHSVLYKGHKYHVAEIGFMWGPDFEGTTREEAIVELDKLKGSLKTRVAALGGHILEELDVTDNGHELDVLLPFSIAKEAASLDDYFAAIDYLINAPWDPDAKEVIATFVPQRTEMGGKFIVPVDPPGEPHFDVTFALLLMGHEKAGSLEDDDYARDDLRYTHMAPEWARDWDGPFEVDLNQLDIDDLFNIIR